MQPGRFQAASFFVSTPPTINRVNTILYCSRWRECVAFYRDGLGLAAAFENDWFVEFELNSASRLSVADARRASIQTAHGSGITMTLKVEDIRAAHQMLRQRGLDPGPVKKHAWGADVFYLRDPERNRIEFWSDGPVTVDSIEG